MEIVDDEYWLNYAKESVVNSINNRNDAAAKLEKMTLWFWGLYTTSFTIGVTINALKAPVWVMVLLASPIILLIVTYWLCELVQLPVNASFDPRIPYEIKEGFNKGLKIKNKRFNYALISTFISALFLSVALFSLSFVNKKSDYSIDAQLSKDGKYVVISGTLPKKTLVETSLDSMVAVKQKMEFYSEEYLVTNNETCNFYIPLKSVPEKLFVTVSWKEDGKEKTYFQSITR
jgi:hypothetical protein